MGLSAEHVEGQSYATTNAANAKNNNIHQHAYVTSYPIARQQNKQRSKRSGNSREAGSVEQSFEQ